MHLYSGKSGYFHLVHSFSKKALRTHDKRLKAVYTKLRVTDSRTKEKTTSGWHCAEYTELDKHETEETPFRSGVPYFCLGMRPWDLLVSFFVATAQMEVTMSPS